jgi:hypothetical protein
VKPLKLDGNLDGITLDNSACWSLCVAERTAFGKKAKSNIRSEYRCIKHSTEK